MRVTHAHFRALGYCNRGARRWLTERGISWPEFLRDGVDADLLRDSGDAMAITAVELAEAGIVEQPVTKAGGCV